MRASPPGPRSGSAAGLAGAAGAGSAARGAGGLAGAEAGTSWPRPGWRNVTAARRATPAISRPARWVLDIKVPPLDRVSPPAALHYDDRPGRLRQLFRPARGATAAPPGVCDTSCRGPGRSERGPDAP